MYDDPALSPDYEAPPWLNGKTVDEVIFADEYLRNHPMKCINGQLFTVDGPVGDPESIRKHIFDILRDHTTGHITKRSAQLLETVKVLCYSEPLPVQQDRIHVANGTYFLDSGFTTEKTFCMNRLNVPYDESAPRPERWLSFLDELLLPEDIPTLQEYIGYLLIPSTRAQKMLMIVGSGGEGKSRIGCVLREIMGDSMNTGSIHKVEVNRFARADLEFKLLFLDDDIPMEDLPQTSNLKTLVTLEGKIDIERKGIQSVQRHLYARFLCFGNGALRAKNDSSYAFFRRQIILRIRPRDKSRKDDPFLSDKLKEEAPGILLWAIEGLKRLIANNYSFTLSDHSRASLDEAVRAGDTIGNFIHSDMVILQEDAQALTSELYDAYSGWCRDNSVRALGYKEFSEELSDRAEQFGIIRSKHINRTQHGFRGVGLAEKHE